MSEHRYKAVAILGEGGFGKVYKVVDSSKCPTYALKQFVSTTDGKRDYEREVSATKLLSSSPDCYDFIVCIYDYGTIDDGYFIVTELMNGDLSDFTSNSGKYRITNPISLLLAFLQCLLGLERIHNAGMSHSDLKPANIMYKVSDSTYLSNASFNNPDTLRRHVKFKIGDLGLACTNNENKAMFDELRRVRMCYPGGTPSYMAPRFLQAFNNNEPVTDLKFFQANDIWGMGQVFLSMIVGRSRKLDPRHITKQEDIVIPIFSSGNPSWKGYDDAINTVLRSMLVYDYQQRKPVKKLTSTLNRFLQSNLNIY